MIHQLKVQFAKPCLHEWRKLYFQLVYHKACFGNDIIFYGNYPSQEIIYGH